MKTIHIKLTGYQQGHGRIVGFNIYTVSASELPTVNVNGTYSLRTLAKLTDGQAIICPDDLDTFHAQLLDVLKLANEFVVTPHFRNHANN